MASNLAGSGRCCMVCNWDTRINRANLGHLEPRNHETWLDSVRFRFPLNTYVRQQELTPVTLPKQSSRYRLIFVRGRDKPLCFLFFFFVVYIFHSNSPRSNQFFILFFIYSFISTRSSPTFGPSFYLRQATMKEFNSQPDLFGTNDLRSWNDWLYHRHHRH